MSSPIKELADKHELSPEDITFRLAKLDVQVTSGGVRNWFYGTPPSIAYAEPLAKVLCVTKARMLEIMHEMAVSRKEAASRT